MVFSRGSHCTCVCRESHWGHWWRRLQPTSSIVTDAKSADSNLYNFAMQGWRRLNRGADVIVGFEPTSSLPIFKRVISCFLQDISTYLSCTAQAVLRTIFKQKSKPKYKCLPSKIVEVWIDRFCVRYDWWRRLQPTSSVSPVWGIKQWNETSYAVRCRCNADNFSSSECVFEVWF